jgi:hypothetical protein
MDSSDTPPSLPPPPLPVTLENLYAPPLSVAEFQPHGAGQMWRLGNMLIATKNTELPPICIKTGAPASVYKICKLTWYSPLIYLGLLVALPLGLIGLLCYVIVVSIISKRGDLRVAISAQAAAARKKWIAAGWIGTVAIITSMVLGSKTIEDRDTMPMLVAGGIILLLTWIIIVSKKATLMKPTRISDTHIFVKGVHPAVLEGFPQWSQPVK